MSMLSKRLDAHFVACAAAAGAAVVGTTQNADAAIVWSGPININIPSTSAGIYLNVVTGVSNTVPASAPGWDVNPWSSTTLNMFGPTPNPGGPYVGPGGVAQYSNLAFNAPIGAGSTYTTSGGGTSTLNPGTPLNLNANNLVGFRFINEANGNQVHYGWMRILLGGANAGAQPRAIVEYAYEDQAGVAIGAGFIPAPGSVALLGMGAVGLLGRRRK